MESIPGPYKHLKIRALEHSLCGWSGGGGRLDGVGVGGEVEGGRVGGMGEGRWKGAGCGGG